MSVYNIALNRRSIRRFKQKQIPFSLLKKLINAARLAPSAANLQPCEFIIVDKKKIKQAIFLTLKWAGYIQPKGNPPCGKEPAAYIVVLINRNKELYPAFTEADVAAAIENILLVAEDEGLGSCWLGAIDKPKIRAILNIPSHCQIKYIVALGYPDEKPKIEKLRDSIKYWKDKQGRLHVPKRSLEEVLHRNTYQESSIENRVSRIEHRESSKR